MIGDRSLQLVLLAFAALGLAASLALAVRWHGWRRGLVRFADTLAWCARSRPASR